MSLFEKSASNVYFETWRTCIVAFLFVIVSYIDERGWVKVHVCFTAAVKRQPVASVVIDHSSENESEDDVSTDDSDEDSSGYLHPLLAGATSSTHSPSKCAGEENSTAGLTLQQSKNNKQVGANTNDSSDSSVQESLEEKQKIASMLQICQHNAL